MIGKKFEFWDILEYFRGQKQKGHVLENFSSEKLSKIFILDISKDAKLRFWPIFSGKKIQVLQKFFSSFQAVKSMEQLHLAFWILLVFWHHWMDLRRVESQNHDLLEKPKSSDPRTCPIVMSEFTKFRRLRSSNLWVQIQIGPF